MRAPGDLSNATWGRGGCRPPFEAWCWSQVHGPGNEEVMQKSDGRTWRLVVTGKATLENWNPGTDL